MSRAEVMNLPIKDRRELLTFMVDENEQQKEAAEEARANTNSKGKKTISGEQLKNYIQMSRPHQTSPRRNTCYSDYVFDQIKRKIITLTQGTKIINRHNYLKGRTWKVQGTLHSPE